MGDPFTGGLENDSVLRSRLETARRQGVPPRQFLRDLFTQDTAHAQAALHRKTPAGNVRPHLRC
jgi:hypothetical protein